MPLLVAASYVLSVSYVPGTAALAGCPSADITGDCRVGLADLAALCSRWLIEDAPESAVLRTADITADGRVSLFDLAQLALQWMTEGDLEWTFERPGNDYLLVDNAAAVAGPNEMVMVTFPVCSPLSLEAVSIAGMTSLAMQGENDNYLFATTTFGAAAGTVYRLHKSPGAQWEKATTSAGNVTKIWPLEGSRLIGSINDTTADFIMKRSDNDGAMWRPAATAPERTMTTTYFMTHWAVAHKPAARGGPVTLLCEYGLRPKRGLRLHKSTDYGQTWSTCLELDLADFPNPYVNIHFHTVGYHAATNRWLATVGDNVNRRWYYSDDDGERWTKVNAYPDGGGEQPVVLLDHGHPREFLAASDRGYMVHAVDVAALPEVVCRPLITSHNVPWWGPGIVFALKQYNGLFYAFECDANGNQGVRHNKIYVSRDGAAWAVAYQFTANERGPYVHVGGIDADGYIYVTVLPQFKTYRFREPTIQDRPMIRVQPAAANLLDDENASIGSTDTSVWKSDTSLHNSQSVPAGGLFAERFNRITKSTTGNMIDLRNAALQAAPFPRDGRAVYCRIIMRGRTLNGDPIAGETYGGQGHSARGTTDRNLQGLLNSDIWVERLLPPFITTGSGGFELSPSIYMVWGPAGAYANVDPHVDIGALMFSSVPSGFQLGGDPRGASLVSRTLCPLGSWTDAFAVIADARASTMVQYKEWSSDVAYACGAWVTRGGKTWESRTAAGNTDKDPETCSDFWGEVDSWRWHVKTYEVDADNRLTLYLDTQDMRFKLAAVIDGVEEQVIAQPAAMDFEWKSQLNFAVRIDAMQAAVSLTVQYAGTTHHVHSADPEVAAAVLAGRFSRSMTQKVGDMPALAARDLCGRPRGDMTTVPMVGYYAPTAWYVEEYLSDDETEALFMCF